MKAPFNVAESGGGSYRLLVPLRWVKIFASDAMREYLVKSR